jgi:hypothetical protein
VADRREVAFDRRGQFAFHALHVIDVVLQEQVVGADRADHVEPFRRAVQREARDVEAVARLDEQADAFAPERIGREAQVVDHRDERLVACRAGRRNADQAVQLRHLQRLRIFDRAADAVLEFADAIGQARDPALALIPVGGQVVQHDAQPARRAARPVPPSRTGTGTGIRRRRSRHPRRRRSDRGTALR